MEPGAFVTGTRRHAECPTDKLVYIGHFGPHGPLDVCEICWMIVARTGTAPQEAAPPACKDCGITHAYGLTRVVVDRWVWDCPMCGAANPGVAARGPYLGTWVPDEPRPDETVVWNPPRGAQVVDLPADDALDWLDGPTEWKGYSWGGDGTELFFDLPDGRRLILVYPLRGGSIIARLVEPDRIARVALTPARRARVRAMVERHLAARHEALAADDLGGIANAVRLAQGFVRL